MNLNPRSPTHYSPIHYRLTRTQAEVETADGRGSSWGVSVPEPGSGEGLPGLDPIDPNSTDPAVAGTRTSGQQLLDGILDSVALAARSGLLPMNAGMKPRRDISTTEADLQRRTRDGLPGGIALLPYTGPQLLSLFTAELCDADVTTIVLGSGQEILNVGRRQRLFTDSQRKILAARDIGCTFPSCTRPAGMCEAHHIIPWMDGGATSIANGTSSKYDLSRYWPGIPVACPTRATPKRRADEPSTTYTMWADLIFRQQ